MTPLNILNAAIQGLPAPRVPFFCNLIDQGARELNLSLQEYFSKGEYVAEAQLKMQARYGHDNVWCLSYVGKEAELLGCSEVLFAEDGPPNVADFVIKTLEDIPSFHAPDDLRDHPAWRPVEDCLAILRREVGETHPICAYVTASTTLPVLLMGMERWMELVLFGPFDLRDRLVSECNRFVAQEIRALRQAGANVIVYSAPFGSPYFLPKKMILDWSMPWMQKDLNGQVDDIVYYCGTATLNGVIDEVMQQLEVHCFYASPLEDVAETKRKVGDQGLSCGIIDDIKLIHWNEKQIRDDVQRIMAAGKPGGHFLFGTGLMPLKIPESNIRILADAVTEYGGLL